MQDYTFIHLGKGAPRVRSSKFALIRRFQIDVFQVGNAVRQKVFLPNWGTGHSHEGLSPK